MTNISSPQSPPLPPHGQAAYVPPVPPPPPIDDVSIRELQETAEGSRSWPVRLLMAFPVFMIAWSVLLASAGKCFQHRDGILFGLPFAYLGAGLTGYAVAVNRAYARAWRGAPAPERGRLFRRLHHLSLATMGLVFLAGAVTFVIDARLGGRWFGVAARGAMGFAILSFLSAMVWGHLRMPEAAADPAAYGRAFATALLGCYEPDAAWTSHDDPKLVAWAKALRHLWRCSWEGAAPMRWFVLVWAGWWAWVVTMNAGRAAALDALAQALGGKLKSYDERILLDWLDRQGWGPAPHVPSVWLGYRRIIEGSLRGVPVAVSVIERLRTRTAPPLHRIDVFLALRGITAQAASRLQARAAQAGYSAQVTPWGVVFSRMDVEKVEVYPTMVLGLLESAVQESAR